MSTSFVDIDRDEMEYVDGGGIIPRFLVSATLDAVLMGVFPGLAAAIAPLKYLGQQAAKKAIMNLCGSLEGAAKWAASYLGLRINVGMGIVGGLLLDNLWCLTSIGGVASLILDKVCDGKVNSWV